jgi:hypothetical protein
MIQGTFGMIQGTFGMIQGTFGMIPPKAPLLALQPLNKPDTNHYPHHMNKNSA